VRRLVLLTSVTVVLALMLAPMALAQDDVMVQEGPPLTASPIATATPTSTVTPISTATNAAEAQYGGGKEIVLPETGGTSALALLAGVSLIGGGVMSLALFRRS
jgi:LPXTG-motif cell wall-anchored protein